MLKRIIKAVTVAVTIACLVVCMLPTFAFADVVEFTEAAKLGATIVDLYGAANNTSLAYEAVSDGSAFTVIETLYQNYSSSANDPYTLAAIGAAAAVAGTIAVVYDAITGKGYVQLYQTQYVESLDGFWDYTLSDLGLLRNNDGFFEWSLDANDNVSPLPLYEPYAPLPKLATGLTNQQYYEGSVPAYNVSSGNDRRYYRVCANGVNAPDIYCVLVQSGSQTSQIFISRISVSSGGRFSYLNQSGKYSSTAVNVSMSHNNYRYGYGNQDGWPSSNVKLPSYSSLNDVFADFDVFFVNGFPAVVCEPEFYIGDPLTAQPTITVPDPASPDYIPSPVRINTGIEWLPQWGNPVPSGEPVPGVPYHVSDPAILNDAVPDIWSSVVTGTSVEVDPDPEPDPDPDPDPDNPSPGEVFNPLLPVTLPSFNFSFSGIWHYVREWVSSLGSWFTTLFLIWSKLPYAMVVPVYATAVVVIVLGVYKRFFM